MAFSSVINKNSAFLSGGAGTVALYSGPGKVKRVLVSSEDDSVASVTLYDSTTNTNQLTPPLAIEPLNSLQVFDTKQYDLDIEFATGLYVVLAGTTNPSATIVFAN